MSIEQLLDDAKSIIDRIGTTDCGCCNTTRYRDAVKWLQRFYINTREPAERNSGHGTPVAAIECTDGGYDVVFVALRKGSAEKRLREMGYTRVSRGEFAPDYMWEKGGCRVAGADSCIMIEEVEVVV